MFVLLGLGLVLTVGVGSCLVMSLVLLPALLNILSRWQRRSVAEPPRELKLLPAPAPTATPAVEPELIAESSTHDRQTFSRASREYSGRSLRFR